MPVSTNDDIWHKRLGHVNKDIIEKMRRKYLALGMKSTWKGYVNHAWKEKHVRSHIRDMMRGEQSVLWNCGIQT